MGAIGKDNQIDVFSEGPADPNAPESRYAPAKVVANKGDAWFLLFLWGLQSHPSYLEILAQCVNVLT